MIVLNSFNKIDILYRNYVKQFSNAYIRGSHLYVGNSLKNSNYFHKCLEVQEIIKTYKTIFIELYMNNNKIYDELGSENICVICLEDLNEDIMEVCHKCNIKCHIKCLYGWYKQNNIEICPICLKTEEYYLSLLEKNKINHNDSIIIQNIQNIEDDIVTNYDIMYTTNRKIRYFIMICFIFGFLSYIFINIFISIYN
tara:strand:- start:3921 stop:4511 length:591 start_codon:yes stop_codon:yes gene_type:complete